MAVSRVMLISSNLQHAFSQNISSLWFLESTALREITEVRIEFLYQKQHVKRSQCLYHRKSLTEQIWEGRRGQEHCSPTYLERII